MTAPSLKNALTISLALHIIAFAATAVTVRFSHRIVPRVYTVNLVTEAPAKETAPAPPAPPPPRPEPPTAKPAPPKPAPPVAKPRIAPVTSVKNTPSADRSYIEDRLSSLKSAREQEDRARSVGRIADEKARSARISELAAVKSSAPGSSSAAGQTSADAIRNAYAARIQGFIEGKWVYPDIDIRNLEAVISVRIRADGSIEVIGFKSPSGQRLFDRSALKALSKASPVEPPPAALRDEIFEIRFSPKAN